MFKIAWVSGAPPQTPLGNLRRSPDPLVVRGFLPSAIAVSRLRRRIPVSPPQHKYPPALAPKQKILEPPLQIRAFSVVGPSTWHSLPSELRIFNRTTSPAFFLTLLVRLL